MAGVAAVEEVGLAREAVGDVGVAGRAGAVESRQSQKTIDDRGVAAAAVANEIGLAAVAISDGDRAGRRTVEEGRQTREEAAVEVVEDRGDAAGIGIDDVERAEIGDGADHAGGVGGVAELQRAAVADGRTAAVGIVPGENHDAAAEGIQHRQLSRAAAAVGDIAGEWSAFGRWRRSRCLRRYC